MQDFTHFDKPYYLHQILCLLMCSDVSFISERIYAPEKYFFYEDSKPNCSNICFRSYKRELITIWRHQILISLTKSSVIFCVFEVETFFYLALIDFSKM